MTTIRFLSVLVWTYHGGNFWLFTNTKVGVAFPKPESGLRIGG